MWKQPIRWFGILIHTTFGGSWDRWRAALRQSTWFKPVATGHISRMHRLKIALEECGIHVEVLTTRDPGLIIWQDEHQIVAEPRGRKF